jgi:hypothetical protein
MKSTLFRSSSAAYRSIRQHEAKNGKTNNVVVEKLDDMVYLRIQKTKDIDYPTLLEQTPNVTVGEKEYKYFDDGANGFGYYELKNGGRRRPNSDFIDLYDVYIGIHEGTVTIK